MERMCDNCKSAFKASNNKMVMCSYWQKQFENQSEYKTIESFVANEIYKLCDRPSVISIGFGSRHKHNKVESHWSYKGTATEGLMTNFQILINKNDYCYSFESYLNPSKN